MMQNDTLMLSMQLLTLVLYVDLHEMKSGVAVVRRPHKNTR